MRAHLTYGRDGCIRTILGYAVIGAATVIGAYARYCACAVIGSTTVIGAYAHFMAKAIKFLKLP